MLVKVLRAKAAREKALEEEHFNMVDRREPRWRAGRREEDAVPLHFFRYLKYRHVTFLTPYCRVQSRYSQGSVRSGECQPGNVLRATVGGNIIVHIRREDLRGLTCLPSPWVSYITVDLSEED